MSRLLNILYNYEITTSNDPKVIWVTELARCLRYSFLLRKEGKMRLGFKESMKMHIGAGLHIRLQKLLSKYGFESEVKVEKKTALGFKIVGRIDLYDKEENVVYELKYTHYKKLDNVKLNNYLRQLNYYVELANALKGYLIIVHGNGNVEEIKSDHSETDLERRANAYGIYLDDNILPPRKKIPDSECFECPFYNFCWKGEKNGRV